MIKNEKKIDFFGDGMLIFLGYITRQYRKNSNYKPHPIIRAFECALQGIDDLKVGQNSIGFSSDGTKNAAYEPYVVVLEKKKNGIELKEMKNLSVNKQLPLDLMILIFRLQIYLDKIEGDAVSPQQMVDALNKVIPGNKFYALGDRWKEARDLFKKKVERGEMHLPKTDYTEKLVKELETITFDTPWVEYSNSLRSLIGSMIIEKFEKTDKPQVIITSPTNIKIEKYKVFDSATEFMLGKSAEYFNPPK